MSLDTQPNIPHSAFRIPHLRYGLIAGNGRFPFLVLEGARAAGVELAVAAIKEETDPGIESLARRVEWISVGHLGKLIKFFKREGVTHALMAGQVKHVQIFKLNALPDLRMVKLWRGSSGATLTP